MIGERWAVVKSLFENAAALPAGARLRWLEGQSSDGEVVAEVKRLLEHLTAGERFDQGWAGRVKETAPAAPRLKTGDFLLGRFTIGGFLGRGGMGEVYQAHDRELRVEVALKTVRPELAEDARVVEQLRREIHNARKIQHENVCRTFDIYKREGTEGGSPLAFIAMEFLEGRTLAEEITEGPLDWRRAAMIAEQVTRGLQAIHDAGIIHRDLKSVNIMLAGPPAAERAVIMDFGLSRATQASVWETLSLFGENAIVGTPAYMSPEQLRGEAATAAADIHALGAVLFEMATGGLPFPGKTPLAAALQRLESEAPRVGELRRDAPRAWEETIEACLAKDPKNRPGSAREVWEGLQRPSGGLGRRWSRRAIVVGGGLAAACVGGGGYVYLRPAAIPREAVSHVQRGEELARKLDEENAQAAIAEFQAAVGIADRYHDAWLGLARVYATATHYSFIEPAIARAKAEEAATRALSIRGDSAEAHGIRAFVLSTNFDRWRQAEPMLTRAIALDPNSSQLRCWYAVYLGRLGRHDEAVAEARKAVELRSGDYESNQQLAVELMRAGRAAEGLAQAKELVRLRSTEPEPYVTLARAAEWAGEYITAEAALGDAEKYSRSERNRYTALAHRATLLAAQGKRGEAEKMAERVRAYWLAKPFESNLLLNIYGKLGDAEKAAEVLAAGYKRGDTTVLAAYSNPYLRAFRDDARMRAIFQKLRFFE
ncbi:MAG: protein kinase domain-containing protein [Bryobacteraceae bacterium]